jgi:hypothetical protein
MQPRDVVYESSKSLANSGIETINLDVKDPITELYLKFGATNGATANKNNPISHNITKIEIVDGSDVLFSMSGLLARSLFAHTEGKIPGEYITGMQADTPVEVIPIRFGRYLYDQEYAFNPVAFRNPQLKIHWNLATVRAISADGFATGTLTETVIVKVMEQAAAPRAFLMSKNIYDFTSAASGDEKVEMPTDYPYRLLMVRAYEAATDLRSTLTNLKLSLNSDKYIPFDLSSSDFLNLQAGALPELKNILWEILLDVTPTETWIGLSRGGSITPQNALYFIGTSYFWKSEVYPVITKHDGTRGEGIPGVIVDNGTAYENCFVYPFGRLGVEQEWFAVSPNDSLKLYLTQGDADAACSVVVQQARPY